MSILQKIKNAINAGVEAFNEPIDDGKYTVHYNWGEFLKIEEGKMDHKPAYYVSRGRDKKQVFSYPNFTVTDCKEIPSAYTTFTTDDPNIYKMLFDNDRKVRDMGMYMVRNMNNNEDIT